MMLLTFDKKVVPEYIGHKYIPLKVYPMSKLEEYKDHRRLKVFYHKGLQCACKDCEHVGYYLIKAIDRHGHSHVDVYTKDFLLMTVDHIVPKARGGSEALSNKQPMCEPHNTEKGCKMPSVYTHGEQPNREVGELYHPTSTESS